MYPHPDTAEHTQHDIETITTRYIDVYVFNHITVKYSERQVDHLNHLQGH